MTLIALGPVGTLRREPTKIERDRGRYMGCAMPTQILAFEHGGERWEGTKRHANRAFGGRQVRRAILRWRREARARGHLYLDEQAKP